MQRESNSLHEKFTSETALAKSPHFSIPDFRLPAAANILNANVTSTTRYNHVSATGSCCVTLSKCRDRIRLQFRL